MFSRRSCGEAFVWRRETFRHHDAPASMIGSSRSHRERSMMKMTASALLVLGLLAVQVSEANAVVCARGVYRAGCAGPHGAVVAHRPVGYGGAAVVRRPYGYGGAAVVRRPVR